MIQLDGRKDSCLHSYSLAKTCTCLPVCYWLEKYPHFHLEKKKQYKSNLLCGIYVFLSRYMAKISAAHSLYLALCMIRHS